MTKYLIELQPLPDRPGKLTVEPTMRLKQLLKLALRGFRFRCISVSEKTDVSDGNAKGLAPSSTFADPDQSDSTRSRTRARAREGEV